MKSQVLAMAAVLAGSAALAADAPPKQPGQQIFFSMQTASGQPIPSPSGPLQVTAAISELGPGESTVVHKHPYLRYDYILEGRIQVTNFDTGKVDVVSAGQFVVDPIGQWHQGKAMDGKRVRLLVVDTAPAGQSNLIPKEPAK
jgi:quercetin dioxygenase-like cupin family protein